MKLAEAELQEKLQSARRLCFSGAKLWADSTGVMVTIGLYSFSGVRSLRTTGMDGVATHDATFVKFRGVRRFSIEVENSFTQKAKDVRLRMYAMNKCRT